MAATRPGGCGRTGVARKRGSACRYAIGRRSATPESADVSVDDSIPPAGEVNGLP
jgi:hypothetical protein